MAPQPQQTIHATTVALGSVAALLRGPSGSGKSDLALRFLSAQGQLPSITSERHLIADDQTCLIADQNLLTASCPATIAGQLEVRGLGIVTVPYLASARVGLVIDLLPVEGAASAIERYPLEAATATVLGISLPSIKLLPFEASAPLKLALALATIQQQPA